MEKPSGKYLSQKAFEIGYAIFRVSQTLPGQSLAYYLEKRVLDVMDAVLVGEYYRANLSSGSLEYFIRLGMETGAISHKTSQVIISELNWLNAAIAGLDNLSKATEVDLENIFSKSDSIENMLNKNVSLPMAASISSSEIRRSEEHEGDNSEMPGNPAKHLPAYVSEQRHSLIVDKVRDLGYCRIKDLQELLPGVSERTVRYDLQKLLGEGLIER
ncbi:MAG: DeoR family transcriptional regulator, partial [Patescibacteria group bacterium]